MPSLSHKNTVFQVLQQQPPFGNLGPFDLDFAASMVSLSVSLHSGALLFRNSMFWAARRQGGSNQFSGTMLSNIVKLTSLQVLQLESNYISGAGAFALSICCAGCGKLHRNEYLSILC